MVSQQNGGMLGDLADPQFFNGFIDIAEYQPSELESFLKSMSLIRFAEQKLASGRRDGHIGGPVHLGVGQEGVAVGVSASLKSTDKVFGAHRSHSHMLALGSCLRGLFAEVLGKDTGVSRGMGGSMHLWDQHRGFYGSVPIVAGTVPLAVGAALAAKMQGSQDIAVAYLGDGAVEEGVVHESLNFARVQNLPILFVVENNLFASHMHISLRQPKNCTARFAAANDIAFKLVDGNDVVQVATSAAELISKMRAGYGPAFLEAVTFRWYGHVDWREDVDVGVHRSLDELEGWRLRDPIARLRLAMVKADLWSEQRDNALRLALDNEIETAWEQALTDPYPDSKELLNRVYAELKK